MVENRVQVSKQPPEVVFVCFYMFTRLPIAKWYLTREVMCQTRNMYAISRIFWLPKMVTRCRKPLWLFDKLGLNWDPFCKNHLRQRLSWARRLRFEPVGWAKSETFHEIRPRVLEPLTSGVAGKCVTTVAPVITRINMVRLLKYLSHCQYTYQTLPTPRSNLDQQYLAVLHFFTLQFIKQSF